MIEDIFRRTVCRWTNHLWHWKVTTHRLRNGDRCCLLCGSRLVRPKT